MFRRRVEYNTGREEGIHFGQRRKFLNLSGDLV